MASQASLFNFFKKPSGGPEKSPDAATKGPSKVEMPKPKAAPSSATSPAPSADNPQQSTPTAASEDAKTSRETPGGSRQARKPVNAGARKAKLSTPSPVRAAKRSRIDKQDDASSESSTVGRRVRVWWPADDEWYTGTIAEHSTTKGDKGHLVVYDDGDREWISLNDEKVEFVAEEASAAEKAKPAEGAEATLDSDSDDAGPVAVKRSRAMAAPKRPSKTNKTQSSSRATKAGRLRKRSSKQPPKRSRLADSDDSDAMESSSSDDAGDDSSEYEASGASSDGDAGLSDLEDEVASEPPSEEDAPPTPVKRKPSKAPAKNRSSGGAKSSPVASPSVAHVAPAPGASGLGPKTPIVSGIAATGAAPPPKDCSEVLTAGTHAHNFYDFLLPCNIRDSNMRRPGDEGYNPRKLHVPRKFQDAQTPAMGQWWEFKKQDLECVLFFKVGKFYELYHMDADVGVRELDMVYMKGAKAHAGFPEIAYGKWSEILVTRGYRVARVEQTQTPDMLKQANAKLGRGGKKQKVVDRELCSIKTKGTRTMNFMDEDLTVVTGAGSKTPSSPSVSTSSGTYMLCIVESIPETAEDGTANSAGVKEGSKTCNFGLCLVDAQTSRVMVGQFTDDMQRAKLRTLLAQTLPVEVVHERGGISDFTMRVLRNDTSGALFTELSPGDEMWSANKTLRQVQAAAYFDDAIASDGEEAGYGRWPHALKSLTQLGADDGDVVQPVSEFDLSLRAFGGATSYLERCHIAGEIFSHRDFHTYTVGGEIEAVATQETAVKESPARSTTRNHMILDGSTLVNLEILENTFDGGSAGTLLGAIDRCTTPFGRRLLRDWVCRPLLEPSDIDTRLDAVENLMNEASAMSDAQGMMRSLPDLEHLLARIHSMGSKKRATDHPDARAIFYEADTYSIRKIKDLTLAIKGFETASKVARILQTEAKAISSPALQALVQPAEDRSDGLGFPDLTDAVRFFKNAFNQKQALEKGVIVPVKGVNEEYDAAVDTLQECERELEAYLEEQRSAFKCRQIKFFGRAKDRYQLEIPETALHSHGTPEDFELKSQRKSGKGGGARRFWSPVIREHFTVLQKAESDRDEALRSQLRVIMRKFDSYRHLWQPAARNLAQIDALMSLATWSRKGDGSGTMVRPTFVPLLDAEDTSGKETRTAAHPFINLKGCRHPCVQKTFSGGSFIPNDTVLGDPDADRSGLPRGSCMLLTGPNMGGKSTLLRQTCTAVILAQIGAYVPAEACTMTPMDRIFTRVGASDRILAGQSTFFVELAETSAILRHATNRSLVILDELGRGTSTFDGNAIAYSVVKHLTREVGACTMFATHYHSLIEDFERDPAVVLSHMRCLVHEDDDGVSTVTFLYKLGDGACPKSYGMNVARLAKLPDDVVVRAAEKSAEFEDALERVRAAHKDSEAVKIASTLLQSASGDEGGSLLRIWEQSQSVVAE